MTAVDDDALYLARKTIAARGTYVVYVYDDAVWFVVRQRPDVLVFRYGIAQGVAGIYLAERTWRIPLEHAEMDGEPVTVDEIIRHMRGGR